jgi:uncharacterized protein (DUF1499 family)
MDAIKQSTRMLVFSAVIMLIILATGPMGYKYSLVPLMPSLVSLLIALVGSMIVFIASLVYLFIASKSQLTKNRNMLLASLAICVLPMVVMGPQIIKARSVPPIHDITTDAENLPTFQAIVKHRVHSPNTLEYGSKELPAAKLIALQLEAYPNVKPLETDLGVEEAVSRAESVLESQGLKIVSTDVENGIVEATATTFWFGFKDDVVVRVLPSSTGSRIDLRSVSRVGQSDIGANAARIEKFLAAF